MRISKSSWIYRLAFLPAVLSSWIESKDWLILDTALDLIWSDETSTKPYRNVSLCVVFWRLVVSPVMILYTIVILPFASLLVAIFYLFFWFKDEVIDGVAQKLGYRFSWEEADSQEGEQSTIGFFELAVEWIKSIKEKYCPLLDVVP